MEMKNECGNCCNRFVWKIAVELMWLCIGVCMHACINVSTVCYGIVSLWSSHCFDAVGSVTDQTSISKVLLCITNYSLTVPSL